MLKRSGSILLALFVFAWTLGAEDTATLPKATPPAEYKIPPEAAKEANPVKPTPESLATFRRKSEAGRADGC